MNIKSAKQALYIASIAVLTACGGGGGGGGGANGLIQLTTPASAAPSQDSAGASIVGVSSSDQAPQNGPIDTNAPKYGISGSVSGLVGSGLVLNLNDGESLAVARDGRFAFKSLLLTGASFVVAVTSDPASPAQKCTVNRASGTMASTDISDISVVCSTRSFSVGGSIAGLSQVGLVLQNNSGDDLAAAADGRFTFGIPVASGADYSISVKTQPGSQTCSVGQGSGKIGAAAVDNITVVCSTNTFTVGGVLSGYQGSTSSLTLQSNNIDTIALSANGSFTFPTPIASGAIYAVTVQSQPSSPVQQTCTVSNGSGVVGSSNVTNVAVACSTQTYGVSGTVSGLDGVGLVLTNNAGDDLSIGSNGAFAFATPVASNSSFNVTVKNQPKMLDQTCTVTNGSGIANGSNTSSVLISCSAAPARVAFFGMFEGAPAGRVVPHTISNGGDINPGIAPMGITSNGVESVVVDPASKYVYALDNATIYQYQIFNPVAVGIGQRSSSSVPSGGGSIVMDPLGRFIFYINAAGGFVYSYPIDASTGALGAPVGGIHSGTTARAGTIDPTGRFLYVANEFSNTVTAFSILATGQLTPLATYGVGAAPTAITLDPTGAFLYVANSGSAFLSVFAANPTNGTLSAEIRYAADRPHRLAFHPNGKFLYMAQGDVGQPATVSVSSINVVNGSLANTVLYSSAAGSGMVAMQVDPTGRFLMALSSDFSETFSVGAPTGALSAYAGFVLSSPTATSLALAK